MIFSETAISGAYLIEPEKHDDARGHFARIWCHEEFEAAGLDANLAQCSVSFNRIRGTLRGMHWQDAPHQETKVVRCLRGSIFDVVIDLRTDSPSFRKYVAVNLASHDGRMLYVPKGCAHGFLTLADDSEVLYFISEYYAPREQRGVRWNDPAIGIVWPEPIRVTSERDQSFPDFAG